LRNGYGADLMTVEDGTPGGNITPKPDGEQIETRSSSFADAGGTRNSGSALSRVELRNFSPQLVQGKVKGEKLLI
jgi:hypothetical protein